MTPAALSRITWTLEDRRAWLAAYEDARRIARVRDRRERAARERHVDCHSVHADVLADRFEENVCAVVDGVIFDTHDPSRDGTRCVYGYFKWEKPL